MHALLVSQKHAAHSKVAFEIEALSKWRLLGKARIPDIAIEKVG